MDFLVFEKNLIEEGYKCICGIDEAGRGPLAGPVFAACVVLRPGKHIEGVNDSKKLTPKKREIVFDRIVNDAVSYSVGSATVEEIEKLNILNATFLAMQRAFEGISVPVDFALVDGNRLPKLPVKSLAVVKGDSISESVAAASIIAKVSRDRHMMELSKKFPQYMFDKHKGYGTKLHVDLIKHFGPCQVHRKSFLKKIL